MIRLTTCFFTALCFCILTSATFSAAAGYKLSMLPRYSTGEINARIVPLAEYLSKKTGLEITTTLTTTFDQYKKLLLNGGIDIGYQNPYIYVLASEAHEVVAMALKGTDKDKFRGIVITASASPLRLLEELKGKKISIVSTTSAGGYLSQKLSLMQNGINVEKDCTLEEAPENKQENVVFAVYTGEVDAGFIRESALSRMAEFVPSSAIRVMEATAWLPNWGVSVSRNMPVEDRRKIAMAIQELKAGDPVMELLNLKGFRMAEDAEYNVVRQAAGIAVPAAK